MYNMHMASNLNPEANENQNQQTAEEFIAGVGKYSAEELSELIEESLLFSSSLSIALQAVEDPCVNEIQTSIVIDKLRITLAGAQEWVKNNGGKKSKLSTSNNDEL
jgi:hypothetical protein